MRNNPYYNMYPYIPKAQTGWFSSIERDIKRLFGIEDEQPVNNKPVVKYPETFRINDRRKNSLTTGKPLNPNSELVSGEYPGDRIINIVRAAKRYGIDPYDALAIDLQETGLGMRSDAQIGHSQLNNGDMIPSLMGDEGTNDPYDYFARAIATKMKYADKLGFKDPLLRFQTYNGLGKIYPETEQNYHGFKMKKIYGVPVPKEGIDMRKNPLYGKRIIDLRDNVLRPDKELGNWINQVKKSGGPIVDPRGQWAHPGEVTRIPSNRITMDGVNYPVYAKPNKGKGGMMYPGEDHHFPQADYVDEYPMMQKGGNLPQFQSRGIQYLDSVINANIHKDFVKGFFDKQYGSIPTPKEVRGWKPGQTSTHLMAYDPASRRVYPEVVKRKGKLTYMPGDAAYNYADSTGEFIQFPTAADAKWFSENYKKGTGVLKEFQMGGFLPITTPYSIDKNKQLMQEYVDFYKNANRVPLRGTYSDDGYDEYNAFLRDKNRKETVTPFTGWVMNMPAQDMTAYEEKPYLNPETNQPYYKDNPKKGKYYKYVENELLKDVTSDTPEYRESLRILRNIAPFYGSHRAEAIDPVKRWEITMQDVPQMKEGGIPQRYKNMGFTRVGQKKQGDGKHKWKVLAKKGNQYKVVQGGWRGMQDYKQHGSEERRERFWDRMGGRNSSKATDPFSPLYWHKRFGTWKEGGEFNAFDSYFQTGGEYSVQSGDTLGNIAKKYGTTVRKIALANNITNPDKIYINQKLVIPSLTTAAPVQEYQDWELIRQNNERLNSLGDEQLITQYYANRPDEGYLVADKKNAKLNYYKGNKLVKSYEVGVGARPGDAQTVTKVGQDGKVDWDAGNQSTGAGVYTISRIDPASKAYYGLPAFNLKNDKGIEVATTIHGTPMERRKRFDNNNIEDNRMSYGCINGKCYDLEDMYKYLDVGTKLYVLPEDQGNRFQMVDGKPVLRVDPVNAKKYEQYVDLKGRVQKGQGANRSVNTLTYKPIKPVFNEQLFREQVFTPFDFNDEEELKNSTVPYYNALVNNKQKIMKAANLPSDVYNEIARMAFGIYGTESNYGDTHSAVGNLFRAGNKYLDKKSSSSPDYMSKYSTYGATRADNSVGLTQMRWNQLNDDEKKALAKVGITKNMDFMDPTKAAIGTAIILGIRYNQQLDSEQKKDIWSHLPKTWNTRENYPKRVRQNAQYLNFQQLDNKMKNGGDMNNSNFLPQKEQGGEMIRRADGSYSRRGLWDNIRANKGSGKKPTKEMLEQERKIKAQEMKYGGINNPGFKALPDYVQAKILSEMGYGGTTYPFMQKGGEPNGGMALGQMAAVVDKMSKLREFISPDQNVDPWIASKLAVMDHSADAISDYMMYNPEAQGYKNGGSTFSGNAWYQNGGYLPNTMIDPNCYQCGGMLEQYQDKGVVNAANNSGLVNKLCGKALVRDENRDVTGGGSSGPSVFASARQNLKAYQEDWDAMVDPYNYLGIIEVDRDGKKQYRNTRDSLMTANPALFQGEFKAGSTGDMTIGPEAKFNMAYKLQNMIKNNPRGQFSKRYLQQFGIQDPNSVTVENVAQNLGTFGWEPAAKWWVDGAGQQDMKRFIPKQKYGGLPSFQDAGEWHPEWANDPELAYQYGYSMTPQQSSYELQSDIPVGGERPDVSVSIPQQVYAPPVVAPVKSGRKVNYRGPSIVDMLTSMGLRSDYATRKMLAQKLGIDSQRSYDMNIALMKAILNNPDVVDMISEGTSQSVNRSSSNKTGVTLHKQLPNKTGSNASVPQESIWDAARRVNPNAAQMAAVQNSQSSLSQWDGKSSAKAVKGKYNDELYLNRAYNNMVRNKEYLVPPGRTKAQQILDQGILDFFTKEAPLQIAAGFAPAIQWGTKATRALPPSTSVPTNWTTLSGLAFQNGGPLVGDEMDVTPQQLEQLRAQGYEFEIL